MLHFLRLNYFNKGEWNVFHSPFRLNTTFLGLVVKTFGIQLQF